MSEPATEAVSVFSEKSPLDGTPLDAVTATKVGDVASLVERARTAQAAWSARTPWDRITVLRSVKDRILDRAARFAEVVHREVGKPEAEALLGEVLPTADVVDYWSDRIEELLEPTDVTLDPLSFPGKRGVLYKEPRGVIVLITPWNYPVALPLRTLIPALLAGNAVLFKPSEVSPRSGALVAELFDGLLPEGVLTLVQGGRDAGAKLAEAPVDLVVFTGSVAAGRKVAHACAERLSPCSLELGGKDAAIVLADANLERAAQGIAWGALTNAGQNCAAIERVYVDKSIVEPFTTRLVEIVKGLRAGTDVGPLSTSAQRDIVARHVDAAKNAGGKVLTGGVAEEGAGYNYAPTVVRVDGADSPLTQEETFGPVIPIAAVDGAEEALRRANDSRYGLTASIWTKSVRRAEQLAKQLHVGVVTVNNHAFTGALPAAPWSGHGETGYGITNSPLALDALTRPRFILIDKNRAKRELWWYPYTETVKTIALAFAVLRSGTRSIFAKAAALFTLIRAVPKRLAGG